MSLVNNVLRELDQRRAADAGRRLPDHVRALPAEPKRRRSALLLGVTVMLAALGGALAYWSQSPQPMPVVEGTAFLAPSGAKPATVEQVAAPTPPVLVAPPPSAAVAAVVTADQEGSRAVPPAPTLAQTPRQGEAVVALAHSLPQSGVKEPNDKERRDEPKPGSGEIMPEAPPRVRGGELTRSARKPAEGLRLSAQLGGPTTERQAAVVEGPVRSVPQSTSRSEGEPGLRQALNRNPADAGARQALVNQLLAARRYPEAAQVLREGLQAVPAQTGWAIALARLQVDAGDLSAAQDTLVVARPHGLQNPEFLAFSGTVQQRLNRHAEALADYEAALRLHSSEGRWWVGYALALEASGRAAEAKQALQRARQTGNLNADLQQYVEDRLR